MASERAKRLRSRAGYSLIELLTTVAIFGALAAAGLPHIDMRRQDLNNATRQIVADYRWARARAITGGGHVTLKWTGPSAYEVQRLKQDGTGAWTLDVVAKSVTLPSTIQRVQTSPTSFEFNTRGMMISATAYSIQTIKDTKFNGSRNVWVWPSGQTYDQN